MCRTANIAQQLGQQPEPKFRGDIQGEEGVEQVAANLFDKHTQHYDPETAWVFITDHLNFWNQLPSDKRDFFSQIR